jgi:hypothetical protein
MADFEEASAAARRRTRGSGGGQAHGFDIVVTFPTKELALAAAEALFDMGAD